MKVHILDDWFDTLKTLPSYSQLLIMMSLFGMTTLKMCINSQSDLPMHRPWCCFVNALR